MGKSYLMESLSSRTGETLVRAAAFLRNPRRADVKDRILIDALDEVAAVQEGDPLHLVLTELINIGCPNFVVSCRSSEWRGAIANLDIAEEYGVEPAVLSLEPLTRDDAFKAISQELDEDLAREIIFKIERLGVGYLLQSPLTLEFLLSVARSTDSLPETRAELYAQSANQLRLEVNERYVDAELNALSEEVALDAAGALMASMLITGSDGICTVPQGESDSTLCLIDVGSLTGDNLSNVILGSRLFTADGSRDNHYLPVHRTVAEFLGARWLARCAEKSSHPSRTAKRIVRLFLSVGGVPASLRGLNAWLPKFSPQLLGPVAIESDPYGVLRYGDGDNLSVLQSRQIINQLKVLSSFDPYFRDDWWDTITLKGLAKHENVDEIRSVIASDEEAFHLRSLLLEAIKSSEVSNQLLDELRSILFDESRPFLERRDAAEAIRNSQEAFDSWPEIAEILLNQDSDQSSRLAVELFSLVGVEAFDDALIAKAVVSDAGLLDPANRDRSLGHFYFLGEAVPPHRVASLLNRFVVLVFPDESKLEDSSYGERNDGWIDFSSLAETLLAKVLSVEHEELDPINVWKWLHLVRSGSGEERRTQISRAFEENVSLRRGIHRHVLSSQKSEHNYFWILHKLTEASAGLAITTDDALCYVEEISHRRDESERELWMSLLGTFRGENGKIPKRIQDVALPYAAGDEELTGFLTKRPKRRKLDEYELKYRRNERDRKRRREKNIAKAREHYLSNLKEVSAGELEFIVAPAKAYLGLFSDLPSDVSREERVREWLGEEATAASLEGFEAVLKRADLPTLQQIVTSYIESRVWNYVYAMLAGALRRVGNQGIDDLPYSLISALAISLDHQHLGNESSFESLREQLTIRLREDPNSYLQYLRERYEPLLQAGIEHVPGLYQFMRDRSDREYATSLSLEWLANLESVSKQSGRELALCVLRNGALQSLPDAHELLLSIAKERMPVSKDSNRDLWRSIVFTLDFRTAVDKHPEITTKNRDLLWSYSEHIYSRYREEETSVRPSVEQLEWIVRNFRYVYPHTDRPSGVTSGDKNEWDATRLLEWAIQSIATEPSIDAAQSLRSLRNMEEDGYSNIIQSAIAQQHKAQVEASFRIPSLDELKTVIFDDPPQLASDVQAIVIDELGNLQRRLKGDVLNVVDNFYDDSGKPRTENECRDQMLIALGNLPFSIQASPETTMPKSKRTDVGFTYGSITVPLEAKGQWHPKVWVAAEDQLNRLYSVDHRADAKGVYVVFWFGLDTDRGRRLKPPPKGVPKPSSAEEMRIALEAQLPPKSRDNIAIVVLDLT